MDSRVATRKSRTTMWAAQYRITNGSTGATGAAGSEPTLNPVARLTATLIVETGGLESALVVSLQSAGSRRRFLVVEG